MTARDRLLGRVRAALGGRRPGDPPPVFLDETVTNTADLCEQFADALRALGGTVEQVQDVEEARSVLAPLLAGRRVSASTAPIVRACGVFPDESRETAEAADVGITSADFALADTGTLVFLSEPRLISLLPPRHIAIVERDKIISGLDELFSRVPHPAARSSSMVLVTGPSRTGDIEMRLVRGVHGPGEIIVLIVRNVTASSFDASGGT